MEALRHLLAEPPPCLILPDLMMPLMDGWKFCAEQKRNAELATIPLVVLTGAGPAATFVRAAS